MPGIIHNVVIGFLRKFPLPDPMKLGLEKNIVIREKPSSKQIKSYKISYSSFGEHTVFEFDEAKNGEPILYFIHGGGFVAGMFSAYYDGVGRLQKNLNIAVICPDYPMPPETDARGMLDFTLAHFRSVLSAYPDSPILISGDSAGGHLSVTLIQGLTQTERDRVKAVFPLFPVLDMRAEHSELEFHKVEVLLKREIMEGIRERFIGDLDPEGPIISPILGDSTNLPPIHIYSADCDPLHPHALSYKTKLDQEGATATHHVFEGYGHDFVLFFPTPDGRKGLKKITDHMKGALAD